MLRTARLVSGLMLGLFVAGSGCAGKPGAHSPAVAGAEAPAAVEKAVTARTRMTIVDGRQFAYRSGGSGSPFLFLQRFRGTMDDWDPAFVDAVAASHRVILFDNAGVSSS